MIIGLLALNLLLFGSLDGYGANLQGFGERENEDTIEIDKEITESLGWGQWLVSGLIKYYQDRVSTKSIHRCPFHLTCSNFALKSIKQYGLFSGSIRFIDRYYFREHTRAKRYYPLIFDNDGVTKLDDYFFLDQCLAYDVSPNPSKIPISFGDNGKDLVSWADHLFNEGDFLTALTAYKQAEYFSTSPSAQLYCRYQIARCYLGLGQYGKALIALKSLESQDTLNAVYLARLKRISGICYARQSLIPLAEIAFKESYNIIPSPENALYLLWMEAEKEEWEKVIVSIDRLLPEIEDSSLHKKVSSWIYLWKSKGLKRPKNPTLATVFSAVLPGSGQIYSGHIVDGIQAVTFVSLFGLATYMAYRYESKFVRPKIGTIAGSAITLTFYYANIWGAHKTSQFRNWRHFKDLITPMREDLINWEYSLPPPVND